MLMITPEMHKLPPVPDHLHPVVARDDAWTLLLVLRGHGPVNARESGYGRLWPIHFGPAHLANPNFGQSIIGQC